MEDDAELRKELIKFGHTLDETLGIVKNFEVTYKLKIQELDLFILTATTKLIELEARINQIDSRN